MRAMQVLRVRPWPAKRRPAKTSFAPVGAPNSVRTAPRSSWRDACCRARRRVARDGRGTPATASR